jgi:hypothetical protein
MAMDVGGCHSSGTHSVTSTFPSLGWAATDLAGAKSCGGRPLKTIATKHLPWGGLRCGREHRERVRLKFRLSRWATFEADPVQLID